MADADGRFKFKNIPEGSYYIRTEVTWRLSDYNVQGGLVGKRIDIKNDAENEFILNELAY